MRSRLVVIVTAAVVMTLALPAHFVSQTLLADELSVEHHVALLTLMAFVLVTLVTGIPRRDELRALGRDGILRVALAGLLGVYLSQQLVLANRFTDAPPGTEVIFFTTSAWGAIVVLSALASRNERPNVLQAVLAGIALVGAIGVLGNWERPSSFSPLVRYPTENGAMLLAGLAWAGFTILVAPLGRRHRWRAILPLSTAVAALAGLANAMLSPFSGELLAEGISNGPVLLIAASSFAAIVISWCWLVSYVDVVRPASLWFVPPVSLTVLGVFERQVAAAGPSPVLWDAVWWACAATCIGALGVAFLHRSALSAPRSGSGTSSAVAGESSAGPDVGRPAGGGVGERWGWARGLGVVSALFGLLAATLSVALLWIPALTAHVVGSRSDGSAYEVSWTIPGAETVGVVLASLASVAALAGALGLVRSRWRDRALLGLAGGLLVVLLAAPVLDSTPLRTWTRWIPFEVQHDYGTEYARLTLEPKGGLETVHLLPVAGASVLALGAACLVGMVRDRRTRDALRAHAEASDSEHDR